MLNGFSTLGGTVTIGHQIPAVIASGTPAEVDNYLTSALWPADGATLAFTDVVAWRQFLHTRGDDFASHVIACYYWLCENRVLCPPGLVLATRL